MSRSGVYIYLMLIAAIAGGCASSSYPKPRTQTEKQDQRAILNEGYSLLYNGVSGIEKTDLIFLVKLEADTVEAMAKEVTSYVGELKKQLEDVARDYPAVNIKLDPLPVLERRKRDAVQKDRLLSFAPIVGLSGKSFERRMLQSLEGPLNQFRFMCKVIAEEEPEPALKQILTRAHEEFERLYASVLGMLLERYFINSGERKVKEE